MQIAVISPTVGLRKFSSLGDIELALPHIALTDKSYADYFAAVSAAGKYVILDNGAFELKAPMETSDIVEAARLTGASELVCSDVFNDGAATVEATREFVAKIAEAGLVHMRMQAVPQGNDDAEWFWCASALSRIPEVTCLGLSKLGVHNCFKKSDIGESRYACLNDDRWEYIPDELSSLHLLGGHAGIIEELRRYSRRRGYGKLSCCRAGFEIRSNDSSAAVWLGAKGLKFAAIDNPQIDAGPVDFAVFSLDNEANIYRNIALWHQASKGVQGV